MSFEQVEQAVRRRLGRRNKLPIAPGPGQLTIGWDTGFVTLEQNRNQAGPEDPRFIIYHQARDSFGLRGNLRMLFQLPETSTVPELTEALLHALHSSRAGLPMPSPWRWGQTRPSMTTSFADEIDRRGVRVDWVSPTGLSVETRLHEVMVVWMPHSNRWNLTISQSDTSNREPQPGVEFEFTATAPVHLVADVVVYWSGIGKLRLTSTRPAVDQPFPLPRVGLTQGADAGLGAVIDHLHRSGLEVLRADLAVIQDWGASRNRDTVTLRDDEGRLHVLTRGIGPGPVWSLYSLMFMDPEVSDEELSLVPMPQPWTTNAQDPYTSPVISSSPAGISAAVLTYLKTLPSPGGVESVYDVPQSFWFPAATVMAPPLLSDALEAVHEWTAGLLGLAPAPGRARSGIPVLPSAALIRTPHDAEQNAAAWMRVLGYSDATATPIGTDEGIDVNSTHGVAQVKTETVPVGRPALQRLAGVAYAEGKDGLFFSLSGYTSGALEWADRVAMPVFTFDYQGAPQPTNATARSLLQSHGIDAS